MGREARHRACRTHGVRGTLEVLTLILCKVDHGNKYLQHANNAHLSNLLATHVKSVVTFEEPSLVQQRDFFRHVMALSSTRGTILAVFEEKLESQDIVLCFWLFLIGVAKPKDAALRAGLWMTARRRLDESQEGLSDAVIKYQSPLRVVVSFLVRCPRRKFFDHLDSAMRALYKSTWTKAWNLEASTRHVYQQIKEDEKKNKASTKAAAKKEAQQHKIDKLWNKYRRKPDFMDLDKRRWWFG